MQDDSCITDLDIQNYQNFPEKNLTFIILVYLLDFYISTISSKGIYRNRLFVWRVSKLHFPTQFTMIDCKGKISNLYQFLFCNNSEVFLFRNDSFIIPFCTVTNIFSSIQKQGVGELFMISLHEVLQCHNLRTIAWGWTE